MTGRPGARNTETELNKRHVVPREAMCLLQTRGRNGNQMRPRQLQVSGGLPPRQDAAARAGRGLEAAQRRGDR